MIDDINNVSLESVGFVCTIINEKIKNDKTLLTGTLENCVNKILSELLSYRDNTEGSILSFDFMNEFFQKRIGKKIIESVAQEPQINLLKIDPHLIFAELWVAFAASKLVLQQIVPTGEHIDQMSFICCWQLSKWAKSGYRMDWHPFANPREGIDTEAPIGVWTTNWFKSNGNPS